ncbi:MAG: response regulator transcription factor [Alphaproteobacteria bacterium]|nr:MAG: response regulator transcription factor [Alphaproteobacteria bacterium]
MPSPRKTSTGTMPPSSPNSNSAASNPHQRKPRICGACVLGPFRPIPLHSQHHPQPLVYTENPMAPRLLLVEDHLHSRTAITMFLSEAGYAVDPCPDFSSALRHLQNAQNDVPDYAAVLTDYNLGHRDFTGLSVCQAMRRTSNRKAPIIASSSEMHYWQEVADVFQLNLVPKLHHQWDGPAVLATLQQLGITP